MGMAGPSGVGGRRGRTRSAGGFNEINVTPFVDVMLVLLIIFMVAAPMMTTGVTVDLPKTKASAVPGNDEPVNISIKGDGSVWVQNTERDISELAEHLKAVYGEKPDTRVFVRGDQAVDYGRIMEVVGEITSAGLTKIALLTDQAGTPPAKKR